MDLCSRHALRAYFPPRGLGRGLLPSPALMLLQKLVPRHSLAASARPSVLPPDPILLRGGSAGGGGSRARLRVPEATPWPAAHARCALMRKSRGTPGTPRGTTG